MAADLIIPTTPGYPTDCLRCGACCASYRVDFSIDEAQAHGGAVPDTLALPLTGTTCRLRGTDHLPPRCAALAGRVGDRVHCGIYEWRPSPCRELEPGTDACQGARKRHGLAAWTAN